MNTEQMLTELRDAQKSFVGRARADLEEVRRRVDAIEAEAARKSADGGGGFVRDASYGGGYAGNNAGTRIATKLMEGKSDFDRTARLRFALPAETFLERKELASTGLFTPQATPQIGSYGGFGYGQIRRLFQSIPADSGSIFQVRETTNSTWVAAPQTETEAKQESTAELSGTTIPVQTVATWVAVSKQALSDVRGLAGFIDSRLIWSLEKELEEQILYGDGTGTDLTGLIATAAVPFNYALLDIPAGWDLFTIAGAAATQVRVQGFVPSFIAMNPADAFRMRFTRATDGQYVGAPPIPPVVESMAVQQGTFLCGDAAQAIMRPAMDLVIDMSEHHEDFFTRNLVAIRAELRTALQIVTPRAFVAGSFDTSPAAN